MKRFTKMIAVLIAAVMILSLTVTALAEDPAYTSAGFKIPKHAIIGYEIEPEESEEAEAGEKAEEAPEAEEDEGFEAPEPEDGEEAAPTAEPTPEIEKKVIIHSSRKEVVTEGERIYLTSELIGFDGLNVLYQWQADRGNGWENVENANGPTYSFIATKQTIKYTWRLVVGYDDE
jgi:hypothetical protein